MKLRINRLTVNKMLVNWGFSLVAVLSDDTKRAMYDAGVYDSEDDVDVSSYISSLILFLLVRFVYFLEEMIGASTYF